MESNASNVSRNTHLLEKASLVKVHASMCVELEKIIDVTTRLIPDIEATRPGWRSGIQELCSLNNSVEKGRLLIEYCAETSKLYSVIVKDTTVSRFERIHQAIKKSLIHIQCMVPDPLANQIAIILDSLMDVKFTMDVEEVEAGNALLSLLRLSDANEDVEFKAFQIATSRLRIASSKELLIERRCIKKLLEKFRDSDKKEKVLRYLLHLIKNYRNKLHESDDPREYVNGVDKDSLSMSRSYEVNLNGKLDIPEEVKRHDEYFKNEIEGDLYPQDVPPEEFICPISSKLMYDPVVIDSGQTYERASIEAWFRDGNHTCPKTGVKLPNCLMMANSSMKKLIYQWCQEHGIPVQNTYSEPSSASVSTTATDILHSNSMSSVHNVSAALLYGEAAKYLFQNDYSSVSAVSSEGSISTNLSHTKRSEKSTSVIPQMFSWSDDYTRLQSFAAFGYDLYLKFLSDLSELELPLHTKALEDVKRLFNNNDDNSHVMLSNRLPEAIISFLKDPCNSSNVKAQKTGLQILLAVLSNFSFQIPSVSNEVVQLLTIFLNSGLARETFTLVQILWHHPDSKSVVTDSGIFSSIMNILQDGDPDFSGLAVEVLSQVSSDTVIRSQILSSGCLPRLIPVLRDENHAGDCLKILIDICGIEEGRDAIVKTDGCIPNIAELLDSECLDEQADATAILLSLCTHSRDNCSLVMHEGVIPALVSISVDGNARGKEDSEKLLHILRRARSDQSYSTETPITSADDKKKPASKKGGLLSKVTKIFAKPLS